jgi:dienelactone hydrolase
MDTHVESVPGAALPVKKRSRHHVLKIVLFSLLAVIILAAGGVIGGEGFYFSNAVLEVVHYLPSYTLTVTDVGTNTVTLERTSDSQTPGEFQIDWQGGQAIVGTIISSTETTVTRKLLQTIGQLSPGTKTNWTRVVYSGNLKDSLGLSIQDVQVPDPLGSMPDWFVPGKSTTWVLMVHGYGVTRAENLRVFQPLAHLGLPLLAISFRNDIGAPASPDGWEHWGDTEWQDVQAAAGYAIAHGAQHLVLYGWSKGGAAAEAFLHRSSYARYVQALVLDAPLLDLRSTLALQAQERSVPGIITSAAETIVSIRSGINFDALDQLDQAQPRILILLFHGTADTTNPVAVSDAFARAHPDIVTYVRVPNAQHTESWNTNPQAYDSELTAFLTRVLHLS